MSLPGGTHQHEIRVDMTPGMTVHELAEQARVAWGEHFHAATGSVKPCASSVPHVLWSSADCACSQPVRSMCHIASLVSTTCTFGVLRPCPLSCCRLGSRRRPQSLLPWLRAAPAVAAGRLRGRRPLSAPDFQAARSAQPPDLPLNGRRSISQQQPSPAPLSNERARHNSRKAAITSKTDRRVPSRE